MIVLKVILFFVVVCAILYYVFPIVEVCGDSMYPTFKDKEFILATRLYKKSKLKQGTVVLFRPPNNDNRVVIKRIDHIYHGLMYCLGDNPDESYDSRNYGYVNTCRIVCVPIKQRKQKVR